MHHRHRFELWIAFEMIVSAYVQLKSSSIKSICVENKSLSFKTFLKQKNLANKSISSNFLIINSRKHMTLHDCFLRVKTSKNLKPQKFASFRRETGREKAGKTFPSNSILMMLIDSQVLATIYFLLLSKLKMA